MHEIHIPIFSRSCFGPILPPTNACLLKQCIIFTPIVSAKPIRKHPLLQYKGNNLPKNRL